MKAWLISLMTLVSIMVDSSHVESDQSGLDEYLKEKGFFLSSTRSEYNEGYLSKEQRKSFLEGLVELPTNSKILEIGFNAGHSAETFLSSPNCAKLVSFDLNTHLYSQIGVNFIKGRFGDHFEFVEGDSLVKVPEYALQHPHETFDLIFIDGGHSFDSCIGDIRNSRALAHPNTILWINDYVSYGVRQAVDTCVAQGIITLLKVKSTIENGSEGIRTWVIARYPTECEKVFTDIL